MKDTNKPEVNLLPALSDRQGAARARELFAQHFGTDTGAQGTGGEGSGGQATGNNTEKNPANNTDQTTLGVWRAPGRVNLIGEHTDYNGGLCLPMALPHATFVAGRAYETPTDDGQQPHRRVRICSDLAPDVVEYDLDLLAQKGPELAQPLSDGVPPVVRGWGAYVAGVLYYLDAHLREKNMAALPSLDLAVVSCVPLGAGLSSSAALECGVAVAALELAGHGTEQLHGEQGGSEPVSRRELAAMCVAAENNFALAPTGGLDQAASLRAQEGRAMELDAATADIRQVPFDLSASGLELLVIDTRAPHQLVDGQYAQRRNTCEVAAAALGVDLLARLVPKEPLPKEPVPGEPVPEELAPGDAGAASGAATSEGPRAASGTSSGAATSGPKASPAPVKTQLEEFLPVGPLADLTRRAARWGNYAPGTNAAWIGDIVAKLDDAEHQQRVRHVLGEIARTRELVDLLLSQKLSGEALEKTGELFLASHISLRDDYEVTCPELDLAVDAAVEAGAIGARMTGGGFGGSAIALVRQSDAQRVAQAVAVAFAQAGFNEPNFLLAHAGAPAGRVD